jgi:predicted RNA-binding Zn ribbon-like protein
MDRLVVALLNTAVGNDDPLETPLGTARWWAGLPQRWGLPLEPARPRFDAALAAGLRELRTQIAALVSGRPATLPVRFRGDGSDAILFELAHAACLSSESGALERIRRCTGQPCGRYFLDETKNGSRRWCSLRCMERARAPRRRTISR